MSQIAILKSIMKKIQFKMHKPQGQADEPKSNDLLPWKYFDLICGSGTGGILALMLGRMRMVGTIVST